MRKRAEGREERETTTKKRKLSHGSPVTIFSSHVYRCFSVMPLTDYSDGPNLDGRERR